MDMPWVVAYELRRLVALLFISLLFALHGIAWGWPWRICDFRWLVGQESQLIAGSGMLIEGRRT